MITLTTDWGISSPSLAAIKARLVVRWPEIKVMDLTHNIPPFDVAAAAWLLKMSMPEFEPGTVHLVFVDTEVALHKKFFAAKVFDQHIICADNGLLTIIESENDPECYIIHEYHGEPYTFYEKDLFTNIAAKLLNGTPIHELGPAPQPGSLVNYLKQPVTIEDFKLTGTIIYIDNYGNLVSNITKNIFEQAARGRPFELILRKHDRHSRINLTYSESGESEIACIFNSSGFLEISLYRGNAHELLGMNTGMNVIIEFK